MDTFNIFSISISQLRLYTTDVALEFCRLDSYTDEELPFRDGSSPGIGDATRVAELVGKETPDADTTVSREMLFQLVILPLLLERPIEITS